MDLMLSRQRSSNFWRTAATPALCADSAHRSSQSSQELRGSGAVSGRQVIAMISASRPAAVVIPAIRRTPSAYQASSQYLIASVSS